RRAHAALRPGRHRCALRDDARQPAGSRPPCLRGARQRCESWRQDGRSQQRHCRQKAPLVVTDPHPLLPTARVADLDEVGGPTPWLVRSLWSEQAVGFIAGTPKSCKSWLGLDLAISVASATPCLERFEVEQPGPTLVFLAEDSLHQVRRRIARSEERRVGKGSRRPRAACGYITRR